MRDMQHSSPNLSQTTFILVNIGTCIVVSAVLVTFFLLNYRSKNKKALQIQHKTL